MGPNVILKDSNTCGNNFGNNFGARSKHPICTAYYVVLDGRRLVV